MASQIDPSAASTTTGSFVASTSGSAAAAAASDAASREDAFRKARLAESLKLELLFLRVPLDHFRKTARDHHRRAERDLADVLIGVGSAANDKGLPREEAIDRLDSLASRLKSLKRKLEEGNKTESLQVRRCRARLDHLEGAQVENLTEWSNTRLNCILVEYMLRMSYYDTGVKLAEVSNIQDLVDIDVFFEAKTIIESIQKNELGPALNWCAQHKFRLKKAKSKFEFQLRVQEFIELIRVNKDLPAIEYARKYLASCGTAYDKELQRVMATLVYRGKPNMPHAVLFEPKKYDDLVNQFREEFYGLYGMTLMPSLYIYLQAGLSVLKTPQCSKGGCPIEDPLSQEGFRKLAEDLPTSLLNRSKLVCYISKQLMDSENPPYIFSNGNVYSEKALREMADRDGGKVTCPKSRLVCDFSQLDKAFIS